MAAHSTYLDQTFHGDKYRQVHIYQDHSSLVSKKENTIKHHQKNSSVSLAHDWILQGFMNIKQLLNMNMGGRKRKRSRVYDQRLCGSSFSPNSKEPLKNAWTYIYIKG